MSKAEDRARDLGYGTDPLNRAEYTANDELEAFIDGYHQAEKDLELTWEDIDWIVGEAVCRVSEDSEAEQICKEILRRFKERKKK